MKHLYLLLLTAGLYAQNITFADPDLKAYLLTASTSNQIASDGSGYVKIDTNADGEIQFAEAAQISQLIVDGGFSSISGLEQFNFLVQLQLYNANLGEMTFSGFDSLERLFLQFNNITALDVSALSSLKELDVNSELITTLDVSGTNIEKLYIGVLTLDELLLPQSLEHLFGADLNMDNLAISNMPALGYANISGAIQMTQLSIADCPVLSQLVVDSGDVSNLSVTDCASLQILSCNANQLDNLIVGNCINLVEISCFSNQLQTLSLDLPNLQNLTCALNDLHTLVLKTPSLSSLDCAGNLLQELDLSQVRYGLTDLNASGNQLLSVNTKNGGWDVWPDFNLSQNPDLRYVCEDEQDISNVVDRLGHYGYAAQVNTYCSFVLGGRPARISGSVRLDMNADGCDATDIPVWTKLGVQGQSQTHTVAYSTSGIYELSLPIGEYQITPSVQNPTFFNIEPANATLSVTTAGQMLSQDFCVTATAVHRDVEIVMFALESAVPGFETDYFVKFRNNGTVLSSGVISITYPEALQDFISATAPVTNSNGGFELPFSGLAPFEERFFTFKMRHNAPTDNPALNSGDILALAASAAVDGDEVIGNNSVNLIQTVVNSFDPNDKTCVEGTVISNQKVGEYVHYTIRFENTGTAPARNIVVKDVLDSARFEASSLVPLAASHDFVTRFTDAQTVEFIFENINLPFDETSNDGFVSFKIKTLPTLVEGDEFSNFASIYFDYNFPIITEPAVTSIEALSAPDFRPDNYFAVYPNPAKGRIQIAQTGDLEMQAFQVYDSRGRQMMSGSGSWQTIDASSLTPGLYFLRIVTSQGDTVVKFTRQ